MLRTLLLFCLSSLAAFAQYFDGRPPASARPVATFTYTCYSVGYCNETRTPLWSVLEVRHAGTPQLGCKRSSHFASEPRAEPPITHQDYANSAGYSRGHMTPNAVVAYVFGCQAAKATFITANTVPQLQEHNAGVWEALEAAVGGRQSASGFAPGLVQNAPEVWIYTGPVFWGEASAIRKLGDKGIWVPTALWKTVIWKTAEGRTRTCSWLIPHQTGIPRNDYMNYVVSMDEVFQKTGVDLLAGQRTPLFDEIDDQTFLETAKGGGG